MQRKGSFPLRVCLLTAVLMVLPAAVRAQQTLYDNALRNGWQDWSWCTRSFTCTSPVHSGTYSISFVPAGWAAVYLDLPGGVDGSQYDGLDFFIDGGAASGQDIRVVFVLGQTTVASVLLGTFLPGGPSAGTWSSVRIPFDQAGVNQQTFDGIWFQDNTGGAQPTTYLDDLSLTARPQQPPSPITVTIDPGAGRHPISSWIYGVSLTDPQDPAMPPYPVRRWGGNATTRYNWQQDVSNRASDWFFINYANSTDVNLLPSNSTADRFVDDCRAHGAQPLLTVPLIGWTPVDRVKRWGFSVAKYGAQQQSECSLGSPPWCSSDAGNGVKASGGNVTGNDPYDTSVPIGASFVTDWMAHVASRVGTAAQGGLKLYDLDNEPMLWNSTHRDVHPAPVDYDEIWQKTQTVAAAMKAQDLGALTLGPVVWGWCAYFYSTKDGCSAGTDYAAHGPFLAWYLDQAEAYRQAHGTRLVDYLDVHYYPQAGGVALSDDESAGTSALRLRSLKSLYDATYTDESWIGQPVYLVPRMKQVLAAHAPGVGFAITEYNWGNDAGLSSALAQAEALAIFGREGVDLACRWTAPAVNTRVEDAFKLYLDYDGAGSKVAGDSVSASSSNVDDVGAYAVRGPDDALYELLFNKATSPRVANVTVAGGTVGTLAIYGFDGASRLAAMGTLPVSGSSYSLTLPARSARLLVTAYACTLPQSPSHLTLSKSGDGLRLTWDDSAGATSYSVLEDGAADGSFTTVTGTAPSGSPGLAVPLAGGLRFYLVAGQNACGPGPAR